MNPVLILTRNCLELTKHCIESIHAQDIETELFVWDNGSTDGTVEYFTANDIAKHCSPDNQGVSKGWNWSLRYLFNDLKREHVLVLNNDVQLPPWFYSELLATLKLYDAGFVTGVAVDYMPTERPTFQPRSPHPDFSAFLITREVWERVGPFDEQMKIYSSDQDFHLRAHFLGVGLWKANIPYFHINSQTLRRATPDDKRRIEIQADRDRLVLRRKWGVSAGGADYQALFSEENFGKGLQHEQNESSSR